MSFAKILQWCKPLAIDYLQVGAAANHELHEARFTEFRHAMKHRLPVATHRIDVNALCQYKFVSLGLLVLESLINKSLFANIDPARFDQLTFKRPSARPCEYAQQDCSKVDPGTRVQQHADRSVSIRSVHVDGTLKKGIARWLRNIPSSMLVALVN